MKLIRKTILRSGPLCREKKNLEKQNKFINIAMILPLLHLTKDPLIFAVRALVSTTTPACSRPSPSSLFPKKQMCVCCVFIRVQLFANPLDCSPPGSSVQAPQYSPGKNTGVGCHALLQGIFETQGSNPSLLSPALADGFFTIAPPAAATAAKSHQSCPTLCNSIDSSPTGSSVPVILQARTLEWVAISFDHTSLVDLAIL